MWIGHEEAHPKIAKLGQLRTRSGSRDILFNFGTLSISEERLKIHTSNLVSRLTTRGTIQKIAKLGQMGRRPGSRDLLLNFRTPSVSKEGLKIQTSNLTGGLVKSSLSKNCKIRSTGDRIWVT